MIIIKNKFIPFGNYKAINLFGIVFAKKDLNEKSKNHEKIHSEQIFETSVLGVVLIGSITIACNLNFAWCFLGLLTYYVIYGLEYLIIRCLHKKQKDAYHDISFEEEAYENEKDIFYIEERRIPFNWIKYMRIKSYKK